MARGKTVRGTLTDVKRTRFSSSAEMHVPGWDKALGLDQATDRTDARRAMGRRMVPKGKG